MLMVIDGNNLAHRVFHTPQGSLTTKQGEPSGVMLGILNAIRQNLQKFPETTKVIVTWDAKGGTNWRKTVYPDYKGNRDYGKDDDAKKEAYEGLWKQIEESHKMLHMVGVNSIKVEGMEADDLMSYCAKMCDKQHVMIITSDKDMLQLVSDNVSIYSPYRDKVISPLDFYEETGVTKEAYIGYRALVGDKSDNIIGIEGIGDKKAKSLMDTYGHINNILNAQGEDKKKLMKSKVFSRIFTQEGLQRLGINNKIMNFDHAPHNEEAVDKILDAFNEPIEVDSKGFKQWLMRWQFVSILADYLTWISPFLALGDDE